ncbi:fluoride efflux transporter CrcB [Subtercola vilae]|uniref:Fluoride-specific ion channel FluC n=1 Tax=Subtercola vilae TaxID=2056433 RepID=A0A4V4RG16_9MICO|nr:fluoride efflux transporter CrcB [Subtercola vilae]TIH39974.1 fluoride efflux transporter CrcB [Subtercola vilae]
MLAIAVAVCGGAGAVARFVLDGVIRSRTSVRYPVGTTVINISGSLLLGLVTGLALGAVISSDVRLILGTGLLGGYTTFSTASFETVRLVQGRRYGAALLNGVGMLVVAVAAAAGGFALATLMGCS